MKLGTETGSLINHVMSRTATPEPEVGMGCTLLMWTDRRAATITEVVSKRKIGIVFDEAIRTDGGGITENQHYRYEPGKGETEYYTLRRNGRWVREGESAKGSALQIGVRSEYYDYSF